MIAITSKKDKFRRCGMEHSRERTEHPDGTFTEEQVEILKAEAMLIVEDDGYIAKADKPLKEMTVADLKELCNKLEIEYSGNAKKADLIELIEKHTAEPPEE